MRTLLFLVLALPVMSSGCKQKSARHKPEQRVKLPDEVTRKLASLRAAGIPTSREEWEEWHARLPGDTNVGNAFLEAYSKFNLTDSYQKHFKTNGLPRLPVGSAALAPAFRKQISDVLADQAQGMRQVEEVMKKGACRYAVRYPTNQAPFMAAILLFQCNVIRNAAQLWQLQAYAQIEAGQIDQAVESILDGVSLAENIGRDPYLISQFVGYTCLAFCEQSAQRLLNRTRPSEAQLERMEQRFKALEFDEPMKATFITERCMGLDIVAAPAELQKTALGWASANPTKLDETGAVSPAASPPLELEGYEQSSAFGQDLLFFLERYDECEKIVATPFPHRLELEKDFRQLPETARQKKYIYSSLLLPALGSVHRGQVGQAVARLRVTRAALVLERYRLRNNGHVPENLDTLAPSLTATDLQDPYDGKPLRFQKKPVGYLLYSIGPDGVDDGGVEKDASGKVKDIVFAVTR